MKRNRCLLVLDKFSGIDPYLTEGNEVTGMPTLFYFIKHVCKIYKHVDIIYPQTNGISSSLKNMNVYFISESRLKQAVQAYKITCKLINKNNDYDFIYTTGYLNIPISLLHKKLKAEGIKTVGRFYGTFLFSFFVQKRFFKKTFLKNLYEILSLKTNNNLIVMTNDGTQGDKVLNKLNKNNYIYLLNGINKKEVNTINSLGKKRLKEELGLSSNTIYITNVSQISAWKRVDLIIDTFEALLQIFPKEISIKLLIIGSGIKEEELKRKVINLHLINKVIFLGTFPHSMVLKYMKASDILTSFYNVSNVGNVLLEGLSLGKCVIARNTGGTGQILNDCNGVVIDPNYQSKEIALIIKNLLEDVERLSAIEKNALEFSKKTILDWSDRMSLEYKAIKQI